MVKASDSWLAGVHGGRPGVIMPAHPRRGDVYERSPLEPQTEEKVYAAGIGEVEERVVKGRHEAFELVSVTPAMRR